MLLSDIFTDLPEYIMCSSLDFSVITFKTILKSIPIIIF